MFELGCAQKWLDSQPTLSKYQVHCSEEAEPFLQANSLALAPPSLERVGPCLLGYHGFPATHGMMQPCFLFQGQTQRKPFSMHSKCSTPKAKECSRLISEWDVWGRTWEFPASHTHSRCQHLLFSLGSVRDMLTTQAERFSKEEVMAPWTHTAP